MAQSAAALFFLAFFAAAAAASVAQAASASSEIAGVKNQLLPGSRKLLADDGMIPITTNDLMPLSAGKAVTSGRAAGVAIQRELLQGNDGMIPITTNDLMPLSAGQAVTSGRAAGVAIQRELIDDADLWFPKDDFDKARSGVAGVQSQRQLIDMIPITANDLLPLSAAEGLTKGRAGNVNIQTDLTGAKVPAA
ncbi:hypothetical protein HU200_058212 [Digitaria exilis]|uniref:Uncharacterized protein n=1 Tax=Digitaria exilis TaxID=1010633 RepID=A0A835E488_9POAL|nr:hypothetical protein HU200_058212 [Digitaria exilis]